MSYVTNVLVTGLGIRKGQIEQVNAKLRALDRVPGEFACMSAAAGGPKFLENDVWGAGFNYVDVEQLLDWIAEVEWDFRETVRVFVCDQEEYAYRLRWRGDTGPCEGGE